MAQVTPRKRTSKRTPPPLELAALLPSWELALVQERKSRETRKSYTTGMYQFLHWCEANGHTPALDRDLVRAFVGHLLAKGIAPSTARSRQLGVQRFSAWCEEEGEIDLDPLVKLRAPQLDRKITVSLTDDQLRNLIKACAGRDFLDRRDEAIIRLMAETGIRAGELCDLKVTDVDLVLREVTVQRGKGGKGRKAP